MWSLDNPGRRILAITGKSSETKQILKQCVEYTDLVQWIDLAVDRADSHRIGDAEAHKETANGTAPRSEVGIGGH
jgi:hypothetical protein